MRIIIVKYVGECKKCGNELAVDSRAAYEKTTGIFCVDCFPIDSEEIRSYRQEKADRKADKLIGWAQKREHKADQMLNSHPGLRRDCAFNTQPGHIPIRAQMNRADDRAFESLQKAQEMRDKAHNITKIQVKGDAEKKHQAEREEIKAWLKVGMTVLIFGNPCEVLKINEKTVKVKGRFSIYTQRIDFIQKN